MNTNWMELLMDIFRSDSTSGKLFETAVLQYCFVFPAVSRWNIALFDCQIVVVGATCWKPHDRHEGIGPFSLFPPIKCVAIMGKHIAQHNHQQQLHLIRVNRVCLTFKTFFLLWVYILYYNTLSSPKTAMGNCSRMETYIMFLCVFGP